MIGQYAAVIAAIILALANTISVIAQSQKLMKRGLERIKA